MITDVMFVPKEILTVFLDQRYPGGMGLISEGHKVSVWFEGRNKPDVLLTEEDKKELLRRANLTEAKQKPLLGIEPEYVWRLKRIAGLRAAICRYANEGKLWPDEWVMELAEHQEWMEKHNATTPNQT